MGRSLLYLTPFEWLERVAVLIPPARRHRHRYHGLLAARLLAANAPLLGAPRIQVFPLLCTGCGKPMRIIAFFTEVGSVQRILEDLGERTTPPPIASVRGPSN